MIVTVRAVLAERLFNDMAPAGERRYPGWLVSFSSAHGDGRGWWMGASGYLPDAAHTAPPPLGVSLAVELDCGSDFTWNVDIMPTADAEAGIALDGTRMTLRGTLAVAHANGLTLVQLGADPLTVTAYGEPPPVGTSVALSVRRLFLYPAGDTDGNNL